MTTTTISPTPATSLGRPFVRLVWAGLIVLTALAAASLFHRSFYIDDAWLGERAYWLAREGVPRSELFANLVGYGERTFVFHKLFALTGAAFISVFGWSLYTLKSVSLVSFVGFVGLLRLYCRRFEPRGVFPVAALVLLAHGLVGRHIFIYRPEVMVMALGFGSFLLLRSFLDRGHWGRLLGGAALAGLSALAHLNGLVFIAAGVVLLLARRRPRAAAAFAILVLGVGGLTFRETGLRSSPLLPFVLGLMVPLAVLTPEKQTYYALPVVPYLALIVAQGVAVGLPRIGGTRRVAVMGLICLFWLNGVVGLCRIIATNTDTASRNAALAARTGPTGTTVLATLSFIFDEIENYRILGLTYYWTQNRFGRHPIPPDDLFEDARARGAEYVVMSQEDLKFSGWPEGTLRPSGAHHRTIYEDENHVILELF